MASPLVHHSQYYMNTSPHHSSYSTQPITLHHPHEHSMAHQIPAPASPSIPLDPALALYPPPYYPYQQQHMTPQHLTLPTSLSSPSSQGSDTLGTPPVEAMSFPTHQNLNGKRPASALGSTDSRKKARKDDDGDAQSPATEKGEEPKAKPTRGSRYVLTCPPLNPFGFAHFSTLARALYVAGSR